LKLTSSGQQQPIQFKDVFATLYHNLGIDALNATVNDVLGRPQYILDAGRVIRELV
jgi:hypothetical protein